MAVKSDVKTGHGIAYVTRGHACGCAGAMAYYTRSGDPPGAWEGRGTAALALSGTVEAAVAERLATAVQLSSMLDERARPVSGSSPDPDPDPANAHPPRPAHLVAVTRGRGLSVGFSPKRRGRGRSPGDKRGKDGVRGAYCSPPVIDASSTAGPSPAAW